MTEDQAALDAIKEPLNRLDYYFQLLRIRLQRLDDYAIRRPYPIDNFENKIVLVEIEYVQIRKILELIMFMTVSAHRVSEIELSNKIKTGWNAEKLMGWLKQVSDNYFPHPIDIEPCNEEGIEGKFVDASTRRPCLNPDIFKNYYFSCGEILHEQIEAITHYQLDRLHERASEFFEFTKNHFETFSYEMDKGKRIVVGHLYYGENKPPFVAYAANSPDRSS